MFILSNFWRDQEPTIAIVFDFSVSNFHFLFFLHIISKGGGFIRWGLRKDSFLLFVGEVQDKTSQDKESIIGFKYLVNL